MKVEEMIIKIEKTRVEKNLIRSQGAARGREKS